MIKKMPNLQLRKPLEVIDYNKVNLSGNFYNKKQALLDKKYVLKLVICKKCRHLR